MHTIGLCLSVTGGSRWKVKDYGEDGLAIYEDGTRETQEEHNRLLEEEAARRGKDGEEEQKPYRGVEGKRFWDTDRWLHLTFYFFHVLRV